MTAILGISAFYHDSAAALIVDGKVVGATASVAYGHTYGKILAFAYIKPWANIPDQDVEVIIAGKPRKGRILAKAVYDPESKLPRTDA